MKRFIEGEDRAQITLLAVPIPGFDTAQTYCS
jgi:hypothetical protein